MELEIMNIMGSLGIISSILVIRSKNQVYSVLYLVLVFCNMTGILLLIEVEFIGILLLVVYVGAVAVLFLFVVMMLASREVGSNEGISKGAIVMIMGGLILISMEINEGGKVEEVREWVSSMDRLSGIEEIGQVLFTVYYYNVLIAGLVLLVAMVGACMLVLG